jgi:alanine dehydrogenase
MRVQDEDYVKAGAKIADTKAAFHQDIVLKIRPPTMNEVDLLKDEAK